MYTRKIDSLGRVVIPKEVRSFMGIGEREQASIDFEFRDDGVFITREKNYCQICGEKDINKLIFLQNAKSLCCHCIQTVKALDETCTA